MRQSNHWTYYIGILLMLSAVAAAGAMPPLAPSEKDKCPVCGMFVSRYPDWVTQIRFKDGKTFFFDGAKDLFKYYLRMADNHLERPPAQVAAIYVTDYYAVRFIDAARSFFVSDSDVFGPMGRELIAFSSAEKAAEFMRDHHGKMILRFHEVSPELLCALD